METKDEEFIGIRDYYLLELEIILFPDRVTSPNYSAIIITKFMLKKNLYYDSMYNNDLYK